LASNSIVLPLSGVTLRLAAPAARAINAATQPSAAARTTGFLLMPLLLIGFDEDTMRRDHAGSRRARAQV
jgi:hypothetical protein